MIRRWSWNGDCEKQRESNLFARSIVLTYKKTPLWCRDSLLWLDVKTLVLISVRIDGGEIKYLLIRGVFFNVVRMILVVSDPFPWWIDVKTLSFVHNKGDLFKHKELTTLINYRKVSVLDSDKDFTWKRWLKHSPLLVLFCYLLAMDKNANGWREREQE